MTDQFNIPSDVAVIIAEKKFAMEMERKDKEAREKAEQSAWIMQGQKLLEEKVSECLTNVPAWLRQYDVTEFNFGKDDIAHFGRDGKCSLKCLYFHVPGLAPIQFDFKDGTWRSAAAYEEWNKDWNTPTIQFINSCYWRTDLEYVLIEAEHEMHVYDELQARYEERKAQAELREAEEQRCEYKLSVIHDAQEEVKEIEERDLFNLLKDDPIAISLLKAFLAIRRERTVFEAQLDDVNGNLYSMEEHWSRKAAELRSQADAAERRADEERNRVSDLEDDLSKAQKKIKQSERGW